MGGILGWWSVFILEDEGNKLLEQAVALQNEFKITDSDIGKDREEARKKAEELAKKQEKIH